VAAVAVSDQLEASLAAAAAEVLTSTLVVIPDNSVEDTLAVSTSHDHPALMMMMTTT
jgi:P pilus assembly chaperone PapD